MRTGTMGLMVLAFGLLGSCGGDEETGSRSTATNPNPTACPYIQVSCLQGWHVMDLPNCRQVCVPDNPRYSWECVSTADCPQIYCITAPCPGLVCVGHKCVMPPTDGKPGKPLGAPCGHHTCGEGEVCCNYSCGICTPPDGFCTQQVCGPIKLE